MGWEPATVYEYDETGRMISSRPEVEWDETEQEWMRALAAWRDEHICPSCGWPKAICQDPMAEWYVEVPDPTRCHVTTALRRAQNAYSDRKGSNPDGLLWGARIKGMSDPATDADC